MADHFRIAAEFGFRELEFGIGGGQPGRLPEAPSAADIAAFKELAHCEGIIPALESAHAMAYVSKIAGSLPKSSILIANLSGRGDKDVEQASKYLL